jgi:transcriptional regulator with XRE-family HTH domain
MANRPNSNELERKIWNSLARERASRGITASYAAEMLGLSQPSLSILERKAVGHSLQRMRDYCAGVLRSSIVIELPGGVRLKPLGMQQQMELTGVNLNGSYSEEDGDA